MKFNTETGSLTAAQHPVPSPQHPALLGWRHLLIAALAHTLAFSRRGPTSEATIRLLVKAAAVAVEQLEFFLSTWAWHTAGIQRVSVEWIGGWQTPPGDVRNKWRDRICKRTEHYRNRGSIKHHQNVKMNVCDLICTHRQHRESVLTRSEPKNFHVVSCLEIPRTGGSSPNLLTEVMVPRVIILKI